MKKKELVYYGGEGYSYCMDIGLYEIKYDISKSKKFAYLKEAIEFYNNLECDKSIWDISFSAELLECHVIKK